jgi:hypothetical protein
MLPAPSFATINFLPCHRKWGATPGATTASGTMVSLTQLISAHPPSLRDPRPRSSHSSLTFLSSRVQVILRPCLPLPGASYWVPLPPPPSQQDKEYVGFAALPNQLHRKSVKKGFDFTLMVAGLGLLERDLGGWGILRRPWLSPHLTSAYLVHR